GAPRRPRHQLVRPARVAGPSRTELVAYVAFDLLALRGRPLRAEPVRARRAALHTLLHDLNDPTLLFSARVLGAGTAFFAALVAQGHEGMIAKHLLSRSRPGQRSAAWRKIKPLRRRTPGRACAVGRWPTARARGRTGPCGAWSAAESRPLLCTEYLAGRQHVQATPGLAPGSAGGGLQLGFVDGKSQPIYPWDSWEKP